MNPFEKDDYNGPEFKPLRWLFVIICISLAIYGGYRFYVVSFSEYRYTIGVISGTFSNSKTVSVEGEIIMNSCTSNPCKLLTDGDRFIVRFFPGHQTVSELMMNYPVPIGIDPPSSGWSEIPLYILQQEK